MIGTRYKASEKELRFLDKDGNIKPNSWQDSSENPSLFNATYVFMRECAKTMDFETSVHLRSVTRAKWETNNGRYMTNARDFQKIEEAKKNGERSPDRFSLDEAIAVAATSVMYGHHTNLEKIELFGRSYSLRPDTFCFLLLCKYPIFNLLLIPRLIVSLSMIISCLRERNDTSGKQLAFVRAWGLTMDWTFWVCTQVLTNKDWVEVFQIYYPEAEHPINELARQAWAE